MDICIDSISDSDNIKLNNKEFILFVKLICKEGNINFDNKDTKLILCCARYFYML